MKKYLLISFFICVILNSCIKEPNYLKLDRFTKQSIQAGKKSEVILVTNILKDKKNLVKQIDNYYKNNLIDSNVEYHSILFIKRHDNNIVKYLFGDDINYKSDTTDIIDNLDFLMKIVKINNGKVDTIIYHLYEPLQTETEVD